MYKIELLSTTFSATTVEELMTEYAKATLGSDIIIERIENENGDIAVICEGGKVATLEHRKATGDEQQIVMTYVDPMYQAEEDTVEHYVVLYAGEDKDRTFTLLIADEKDPHTTSVFIEEVDFDDLEDTMKIAKVQLKDGIGADAYAELVENDGEIRIFDNRLGRYVNRISLAA